MSESAVRGDLQRQAQAWWRVARVTPVPYFRPPYGSYDSSTLAAAGDLGFARTMLWDVDPQDWRRPGASVIVSKVLGAIGPGDIVVMHVQAQTADALPSILDGLRRRGLIQSSLPELFAAAGLR
jgi:peptidoglycan/xylan/chitin deacetylase (PgdA/CDA1 family)